MSKGSKRRQPQISKEEEDLRWDYFFGRIPKNVFERKLRKLKGKNHATTGN